MNIRLALGEDIGAIQHLIELSSKSLGTKFYSGTLIEAALLSVLGVDTRLIEDGTYYLAERKGRLAGCGGWSRRRTLFGSDAVRGRDDGLLDPATEPAKIRAFFVHPDHARRGVGSAILARCEAAASRAGFTRLELGATLSGVDFYLAHGYVAGASYDYRCAPGLTMEIVPMRKEMPG